MTERFFAPPPGPLSKIKLWSPLFPSAFFLPDDQGSRHSLGKMPSFIISSRNAMRLSSEFRGRYTQPCDKRACSRWNHL